MAINNVGVQHDGAFLPDMILLTLCYYLSGNPIKNHEVLSLQSIFFPPTR